MESLQPFLDHTLAFFREGFNQVNAVQGLIIALVAAVLLTKYGRILIVVFGATLVHLIADVLLPVVANGADFALPQLLTGPYWRYIATLYVGYFVVVTLFYVIKRILFRR